MYNTKDVKTATDMPTFIPAGIHENIKLVSVKYDITASNNEFIAFYFENEHGDTFSHTEWPVKLKRPLSAMSEEEAKNYRALIEIQTSRIKQIIETFIDRGSYKDIEANNFKEFAEQTIKILSERPDKKVRIKIIYNFRNFTSFPSDARHTFIESMDVTSKDSKIRVLPSDKMVRSLPDVEQKRSNPFADESASLQSTTELRAESASTNSNKEDNLLF